MVGLHAGTFNLFGQEFHINYNSIPMIEFLWDSKKESKIGTVFVWLPEGLQDYWYVQLQLSDAKYIGEAETLQLACNQVEDQVKEQKRLLDLI